MIEKCRSIVAYFKRSSNAAYKTGTRTNAVGTLGTLKTKTRCPDQMEFCVLYARTSRSAHDTFSAAIFALPGRPDNFNADE